MQSANIAAAVRQAPAPTAPKRMRLDAITKGRIEKPMRILLAGTEGIGKSTFAGNSPAPIFLGAEDGTAELDVARLPEPETWGDALDAISLLTNEPHDYRTFVIDTLDWLEPLCHAAVCAKSKKDSIEDFGFGKGYIAALDEWRVMLSKLDALREKRRMHIILLAHSSIRLFKNPTGDDFDRYELKLNAKASGLLKEWSDAVLFANYETFAVTKEKRTRGVSSGARLIYTARTAAWDAKNRYGLPPSLPLSWDDFEAAVKDGAPADPKKLLAEIATVLLQVDEGTRTKITTWLAAAERGPRALAETLDRLRGKIQIKEQDSNNQPKEEAQQ